MLDAPPPELPRHLRIVSWTAQIVAAAILAQTLYFKFTAAPESVYIFTTLGMEPWGRIGTAVVELVTATLLLVPTTAALGAVLALGLMTGAIFFHLTKLGISVQGDGGLLFGLAILVFTCAATVALLRRAQIPVVGKFF